ncbi:hypothetical protein, partial [Bacteroides faecis]|uniref:hypothetical protein n=1 Tax=Bacteroides faecis TaxID=674529 RepID=UPI0032EFE966
MILKECGKPTVSQSLSLKELYSAPGESRSNKEFPTKLTVFLLLFPKTSIFSLIPAFYQTAFQFVELLAQVIKVFLQQS